MLNCKQITELASKSLDATQPWYLRLRIKFHLLMCKTCRRYAQHLSFIQTAVMSFDQLAKNITLSEQAKTRINKKLQENQK